MDLHARDAETGGVVLLVTIQSARCLVEATVLIQVATCMLSVQLDRLFVFIVIVLFFLGFLVEVFV